jgi:phenylacetate-CoA ligase
MRNMTSSKYFQPEIETMEREQLVAAQAKLIHSLVSHADKHSALYRGRWRSNNVSPHDIRTIQDFKTATPLLTKAELVDFREQNSDPYCGILCADPLEVNNIGTSSGTTAEPMPLIELVSGAPPFASSARDMWGAGLRPGDRVLHTMITVRGPQERVYQKIGCVPLMINLRHDGDWNEVIRMIKRHRPAHIYLSGPMLSVLEQLSQDHDLADIFSCIKFAVFSGEPLGARMRARLRDDWKLHVYDVAGAADTGVAWECEAHDGFHLWDDYVLAECIDPVTGREVAEGEPGELVCTALANLAWPLIRYRSGDLVKFDRSRCGCGRTHTRFKLMGRLSDKMTIAGKVVLPMQVWGAIELIDATATAVFQIIHSGEDHVQDLRLRVGYNPRVVSSLSDLELSIKTAVREATGLEPAVELLPEAQLLARSPSGFKLPRVVKA